MLTWKSKKNENGKRYWQLDNEDDKSMPQLILFVNEQHLFIARAKNVNGSGRVINKVIGNENTISLAQAKDLASGWLFHIQMNPFESKR